MQDYQRLEVWKLAHELVLLVYPACASFPSSEIYGLTSQIKRAALSIPANIAEGCGRDSAMDFARFLQISQGSASELDYHLRAARDLHFLEEVTYQRLVKTLTSVRKMLTSLILTVRSAKQLSIKAPRRQQTATNQ